MIDHPNSNPGSLEREYSRGARRMLAFLKQPSRWPGRARARSRTCWWGKKSLATAIGSSVSMLHRYTVELLDNVHVTRRGNRNIYSLIGRPVGAHCDQGQSLRDNGLPDADYRTPAALELLAFFRAKCAKTGTCSLTQAEIGKAMNWSRGFVSKLTMLLRQKGQLIEENPRGRRNIYRVVGLTVVPRLALSWPPVLTIEETRFLRLLWPTSEWNQADLAKAFAKATGSRSSRGSIRKITASVTTKGFLASKRRYGNGKLFSRLAPPTRELRKLESKFDLKRLRLLALLRQKPPTGKGWKRAELAAGLNCHPSFVSTLIAELIRKGFPIGRPPFGYSTRYTVLLPSARTFYGALAVRRQLELASLAAATSTRPLEAPTTARRGRGRPEDEIAAKFYAEWVEAASPSSGVAIVKIGRQYYPEEFGKLKGIAIRETRFLARLRKRLQRRKKEISAVDKNQNFTSPPKAS